jgi:hypothetical protein
VLLAPENEAVMNGANCKVCHEGYTLLVEEKAQGLVALPILLKFSIRSKEKSQLPLRWLLCVLHGRARKSTKVQAEGHPHKNAVALHYCRIPAKSVLSFAAADSTARRNKSA